MSHGNQTRTSLVKPSFFRLLLLLTLVSISLAFHFYPDQAQSSETSNLLTNITIAHAPLLDSTPLYVAVEKGYFKPDLVVSLHGFPAGKDALDEVLKGAADLGTVAETPFINAVMRGEKISIIASISETTNSLVIIGRKDKGLRRPMDLRGKKIGEAKGTGAEFFLSNVLLFNEIPKSSVKTVHFPLDKMMGPLLNGEVDAVVSWGPFARQLLDALGANGFTYYGTHTYNRYTWNLAARKTWIDQKPEALRQVIQALVHGVSFIKKHPSEGRKVLGTFSKMDESEISRLWGSTVFKVALHPRLLMSLEDQARWAIRNKLTKAKTVPNFLNDIYFDGLAVVDPAAVTIAH